MDWKKRFDIHKEASCGLITGVILLIAVLVLYLLTPRYYKGMAITAKCTSHLSILGEDMYKTASEKDPETLQKMMVHDLVREMVHQRGVPQEFFLCAKTKEPYHVFPVPADLFFRHMDGRGATAPPVSVAIAMCRPDVHHMIHAGRFGWFKKYGVLVLYSDGHVERVSREEAEKLVSELSPEPIEFPTQQTAGPDDSSSGHPSDSTP